MTRDPVLIALADLLEASLAVWRITPSVSVERRSDAMIGLVGRGELIVRRAAHGLPFRWVVNVDGRKRTAASVSGVLRIVRQHFEPEFQPLTVTIAAPVHEHREQT